MSSNLPDEIHFDVLEHLGKGVTYFDTNLNLIYYNSLIVDILGIPKDMLIQGAHLSTFLRFNATRGDYGDGDIEKLVHDRIELAKKFESHDFERVLPDGMVLRVQGINVEGRGFVTTYEDITELKNTQRALEQLNSELDERVAERTRTLNIVLDSMKNGITLIDKNLAIKVANSQACELLDIPKEVLSSGKMFHDSMRFNAERGEYGEGDIETLVAERVALASKFEPHNFVRKRKDGTFIEIVGRPVDNGFVSTYTDVTDYMSLEEELRHTNEKLELRVEERTRELLMEKERAEEASRSKTEFLAHMSHELRTPLNSIIGFSESAMCEIFGKIDNQKYKEHFEAINTSGSLLLSLINDILEIARLESGKSEMHESAFDPEVLISSVIFDRAKSKNITLSYKSDILGAKIFADSRRFQQILLNLLTNAIKFTNNGGKVHLSLYIGTDGELIISVKDNGIGMDQEESSMALEPFSQVNGTAHMAQEGSGLGLPIVNGLVLNHGGTIEVLSEKNIGTNVVITLPAERLIPQNL